jgi:hypothetical protein
MWVTGSETSDVSKTRKRFAGYAGFGTERFRKNRQREECGTGKISSED